MIPKAPIKCVRASKSTVPLGQYEGGLPIDIVDADGTWVVRTGNEEAAQCLVEAYNAYHADSRPANAAPSATGNTQPCSPLYRLQEAISEDIIPRVRLMLSFEDFQSSAAKAAAHKVLYELYTMLADIERRAEIY